MKKYNRFSLTLFLVSICAAVLSVIARIFLTTELLDKHGVYMHGSLLPTVYHLLLAAVILTLVSVAIIKGRKNEDPTLIKTTNLTVFTACVSAFLITAYLFLSIYDISKSYSSPKIIDVLELASAIPTIIFFFLLAFQKGKRTPALGVVSLFPAIWSALGVMKLYFNTELLMNNPDKILGQFALIISMLFFLFESRNQIGIPLKGFYQATAVAAPILLLTASIPNLVCSNKLSDGSTLSTIRYMVYIALAVFMYSRAMAYLSPSTDTNDLVNENQ